MYLGEPARAAWICAYKSCFCHDSRRAGSLTGRLAFIGKAVWGRLSVDLSAFGGCSGLDFGPGVSGIRSSWLRVERSADDAKLLLYPGREVTNVTPRRHSRRDSVQCSER